MGAGQAGNAPVVSARRLPCEDADEGTIRARNRPSSRIKGQGNETGLECRSARE